MALYNEDGTPIIQAHGRFADFHEIDEENIYQSSYYDEEEDGDEVDGLPIPVNPVSNVLSSSPRSPTTGPDVRRLTPQEQ